MRSPRYKTLVDEFVHNIRQGIWAPGLRLPTHRVLAQRHGIALATASRVYAELDALGLVAGETGRGTYVRDRTIPPGYGQAQYLVREGVVDLAFNYPSLPSHADDLRRALRELSSVGDIATIMQAQPTLGRTAERHLVATYLKSRGMRVRGEEVALVNGAQQGLAATVMALLKPGDVVAIDALTYPGFIALAQAHGLELAPISMTAHGPNLAELERILRARPVKAIFTMPTLHNPMGWVMGEAARTRLVQLARRHDVLLIEDETYAFLKQDAPAPVRERAPERTVYVSGLSKSVAGGMRFGFLVAPPQYLAPIERSLRAMTWSNSTLVTALCGRWLEDGTVTRMEQDKRDDVLLRQNIVDDELTGLHLVRDRASYFVWISLPADMRADRLAGQLARKGILVACSEAFSTAKVFPHAIRLSLGATDLVTLRRSLRAIQESITYYVD